MVLKTVTVFIVTSVLTLSAMAQQSSNQTSAKAAHPTVAKMEEGVIKKGGKMWYIKSITSTMPMATNVEINSDGILKIKHKTKKLSEGDCINYQGELVVVSKNKIKIDSFVMRKNNAVWVWRILNSPVDFTNGTTAMPDGSMKTKDGKVVKIKDDEFIDMNGSTVIKKEYSF